VLVETSWLGRGRGGGSEKSREFRSKLAVGDSLVAVILITAPEGNRDVGRHLVIFRRWGSQLITHCRTSLTQDNLLGGQKSGTRVNFVPFHCLSNAGAVFSVLGRCNRTVETMRSNYSWCNTSKVKLPQSSTSQQLSPFDIWIGFSRRMNGQYLHATNLQLLSFISAIAIQLRQWRDLRHRRGLPPAITMVTQNTLTTRMLKALSISTVMARQCDC